MFLICFALIKETNSESPSSKSNDNQINSTITLINQIAKINKFTTKSKINQSGLKSAVS